MNLVFSPLAWENYQHWLQTDKKMVRRINELIKDTVRNHYDRIGKPEPLNHTLAGFWSRRITDEHRMIYRIAVTNLEIAPLRLHYSNSTDARVSPAFFEESPLKPTSSLSDLENSTS